MIILYKYIYRDSPSVGNIVPQKRRCFIFDPETAICLSKNRIYLILPFAYIIFAPKNRAER